MADDPVENAIEFQRRTLEGTQRALEQHIEFQKRFGEVLRTGISSSGEAQGRTADVSRRIIDHYLDAIEATVPGAEPGVEQIREAMDDQFDAMADVGDDVRAIAEEGVDDYERAADAYLDGVASQLDLVAEAHAAVEANTADLLEETEAQLDSLADEGDDDVAARIESIQNRARELRADLED